MPTANPCPQCHKPLPTSLEGNHLSCPSCRQRRRRKYVKAAPAFPAIIPIAGIPAPATTPRPQDVGGNKRQPAFYWRTFLASSGLVVLAVALVVFNSDRYKRVVSAQPAQPKGADFETALDVEQLVTAIQEGQQSARNLLATILPPPKEEPKVEVAQKAAATPKAESPSADNIGPTTADAVGAHKQAQPVKLAEAVSAPVRPPVTVKRRSFLSDEELRRQLLLVPEIHQKEIPVKSRQLLAAAPKDRRFAPDEIPDFGGLPMRMGVDCQLGKESAEHLQNLSRTLRTAFATATAKDGDPRMQANMLRLKLLEGIFKGTWSQPEAVPVLAQMLMAENKQIRILLVGLLAEIPDSRASVALAQRAIFDLSNEVRTAAIKALDSRPRDEFRATLLAGLRHVWPPVADHAAEALVALQDRESIGLLKQLADVPDPREPVASAVSGRVVRELVRINHLANCTLCHARSSSTLDPVRGQVPPAGQPLPPPTQYYESTHGMFVRADVTYLQQEFSVPQPVANADPWPANQRFDYLVRERPINVTEMRFLQGRSASGATTLGTPARKKTEIFDETRWQRNVLIRDDRYPQRESVMFALRELTRKQPAAATEEQPTKSGE